MAAAAARVPAYVSPFAKNSWTSVQDGICSAITAINSIGSSKSSAVEMEIRFGKYINNKFAPGVSKRVFESLSVWFDTGKDWAQITDWHNSRVFFYKHSSIEGTVRSEYTLDNETDCIIARHVHKEKISNLDYVTTATDKRHYVDSTTIRLATNVEHTVDVGRDLSDDQDPFEVHLRERKVYEYAATSSASSTWAYCLTRRWKGANLTEALEAKNYKEPTFEIEIECVDTDYLKKSDTGHVALKMLSKVADIIGTISPSCLVPNSYTIDPVVAC